MRVPDHAGKRQPATVDDGSVVLLIEQQIIIPAGHTGQDTQVNLEAGAEQGRCFLTDVAGQTIFQFHMNVKRTVQEGGARTAGAIFINRFLAASLM